MQRLRVRLMLPAVYAGGQAIRIEATDQPDWSAVHVLDVARRINGPPTCWHHDGFLVGQWLGAVPPQGWLEDIWLHAGHMQGCWQLEAVSWRMHFGRLRVRAVVEGAPGQAAVAAQREVLINEPPPPVRRVRLLGQDTEGRIRMAFVPPR